MSPSHQVQKAGKGIANRGSRWERRERAGETRGTGQLNGRAWPWPQKTPVLGQECSHSRWSHREWQGKPL